MIDTAGTLCGAAAALKNAGAAEIYTCATHGVLSGPAVERIRDSDIKEVVLLDTIAIPQEKIDALDGKLTLLPIAPVFAEAIERVYEDKPVSVLFK